ncbi:MAG: nuclear transport factor 2 family protein [Cyclobacteriaceae bacterium]
MTKVKSIFIALLAVLGIQAQAQSLKADDVLAIQNQISLWNQLQDDGNVTAFMNIWTTDAVFTNPFGKFAGKDAIKQFVDGYVSGFAKGKRHQSSNITITGSGSKATVVEDLNVVEVNEIPFIAATVRLNASLVKEGVIWKFKDVTLLIDPGFGKLQAKMAGK